MLLVSFTVCEGSAAHPLDRPVPPAPVSTALSPPFPACLNTLPPQSNPPNRDPPPPPSALTFSSAFSNRSSMKLAARLTCAQGRWISLSTPCLGYRPHQGQALEGIWYRGCRHSLLPPLTATLHCQHATSNPPHPRLTWSFCLSRTSVHNKSSSLRAHMCRVPRSARLRSLCKAALSLEHAVPLPDDASPYLS